MLLDQKPFVGQNVRFVSNSRNRKSFQEQNCKIEQNQGITADRTPALFDDLRNFRIASVGTGITIAEPRTPRMQPKHQVMASKKKGVSPQRLNHILSRKNKGGSQ